jgi:nucleoside phosphorylase
VLICFALKEEGRFFSVPPGIAADVHTLVTGVGRRNAAQALGRALAQQKPDLVLTCGYAGGLRDGLPIGTVIYSEDAGAELAAILCSTGAVPVCFHCSARIATTAAEKQKLRRESGADAVEMESEVIRQLCRERHIPSATVRAISDTSDEDMPLDFNLLMTKRLELHFGKLAWALLGSPQRIPALLKLQRHTRQAAQSLAATLSEVLRRKCAAG